jgi:hypothetical protein
VDRAQEKPRLKVQKNHMKKSGFPEAEHVAILRKRGGLCDKALSPPQYTLTSRHFPTRESESRAAVVFLGLMKSLGTTLHLFCV